MVDPLAGHGHPFNDRPSCDGDPSKENAGDPDRGGGCHPYPAPGVQGGDDGGDRNPGGGGCGIGADGATGSPVPVEDDPGGCGLWVLAGVGSALVGGVRCCDGVPRGAESRAVFPIPFPPPLLVGVVVVVPAFGSAVETSLVSCTPIAAAVARPAAAAEPTDAALGPKSLGPAAPPAPDLASAPPGDTEGVGGRVSSAASVTTVVFAAAVVAV